LNYSADAPAFTDVKAKMAMTVTAPVTSYYINPTGEIQIDMGR
jgi:hypothetical protein